MALDRRTRRDSDYRPMNPRDYFTGPFAEQAERNGAQVAEALAELGGSPLTLLVDGEAWSVIAADGTVVAVPGNIDGAVVVSLTTRQFSDFVQNQVSFNGLMTARAIAFDSTELWQVSLWDSLWLTLIDGWPTFVRDVEFRDRHGAPIQLDRKFGPHDDPADVAHFLREAGYVHLRGWLDPAMMASINQDIDRALPSFREGDGCSWWAALADGSRTCVRMQKIDRHSEAIERLIGGEVWNRMRLVLADGDPLIDPPAGQRLVEALVKPIGVVAGPSDLPFHRDCHLGRHVYDCSHVTVGIALTPTSRENGLLQVMAGSHRVAMPVEVAKSAPYLPLVEIETEPGDMTVHLSCTLHASTPPTVAERRVMYVPMVLAGNGSLHGEQLGDLRERVTDILRDEHGTSEVWSEVP